MIGEAHFSRLRAAFDEIHDLPTPERDKAIRRLSGADSAFEFELRGLLAAAEQSTTPLDTPPLRALRESATPPAEPPGAATAATAATEESLETVPGYLLLRPIGRGGSATVYLAEQQGEGFTRPVALKILGRWVDASLLRRFRAEQRILAALEHPGIARLYDAGITPSGRPYLAMELVRGVTLVEHCARIDASPRDRIALFCSVLEAVEHAHASSIVHRDLKPGNILVSERGEAKLLDFGIARLLETEAPLDATETQHRAMTPAYASPEQVRGEPVERASDIYSLGVILYELLTGRRPYKVRDTSLEALERAIRERDPEPPGLGGDLDSILAKALRKEPAERYASAADFATDLQRYLDGRSVLARRGSVAYRIGKEVRRRRGLWLNAALAAALLAGIAVWLSGGLSGSAVASVDPNASPWLAMPVRASAAADYGQGLDALARSETTVAIAKLRRAEARDPGQPLIHAALATAHARASHDLLARAEGQQALQLATGAPRESRLLIEAVALQTSGQKAEELERRRSLWLLAPGNFEAGHLLARSLTEGGAPEEALQVAAQLRALPAGSQPPGADLRIGLLEGEALNVLGRPADAARIAQTTVAQAKARHLPAVAAQALLQEGQARDGMGDRDQSVALAEEARRLFEPRGESGGVVRALNLECLGAVRRSLHEQAETLCGECARRAERVGNSSGVARAFSNLGISRRRRGHILSAREAFSRALQIERQSVLGDRVAQGKYLHNLANIDMDLGRLAEAEGGFRQAIVLLREASNQLSLMRTLGSLAVVLMYRGSLAEAETVLAETEPIARKTGSASDLANTLWQRGDLAKLEGKMEEARRWFDQAAVPLESVTSGEMTARFKASRKQLAEPSERACRDLESSAGELARLGDRTAVELSVGISRCWSDAGFSVQAQRWLDRSEKEATASQLPSIRVEFELAKAAVALGTRRWSEADEVLQGAAAECRRVSLGYHLMETRLLEARLALARGDHPERVRTLAEELERDALAGRFGKIARDAGEILRARVSPAARGKLRVRAVLAPRLRAGRTRTAPTSRPSGPRRRGAHRP
ncbi:MAG TPA: protein kinase [Thermoanaerobaculia bacterium]|jgi:tetratricopeptide (TPR) repeat protein|nr:protein kinase [Thermoanaerobaculia bacterium]